MCDYIVANPDRFPHPVMGYLYFDVPWAKTATLEARPYCTSLGIGDAGVSTFNGDESDVRPQVQTFVDAGATIIYTNSHENGPALIARTLFEMGLQDKVTLATVNVAMDPYVAFSGEADLKADGLPAINGMLGSMPVRSLAETDNPGIQLITAQADLHQRPLTMRTDGYIMGWDTTDLLIEVYIQTGNRVGFDHITGADVKATLENIVYATSGFGIWAGILLVRALGGALHPVGSGLMAQGWHGVLRGEKDAGTNWWKRFGIAVAVHAAWNGGSLLVITLGGARFFGELPPEIDLLGLSAAGTTLAFLLLLGITALWIGRAYGHNKPILAIEGEAAPESEVVPSDRAVALWAVVCLIALVPAGIAGLEIWLR